MGFTIENTMEQLFMIIFDLDGTLADCEHRRHFVDPKKNPDYELVADYDNDNCGCNRPGCLPLKWVHKLTGKRWKPDWKAFYEACHMDHPIYPVIDIMLRIDVPYQIWSARCESVRQKTEDWLLIHTKLMRSEMPEIKMRPIGDSTPDDELKERWLNEFNHQGDGKCLLRWANHSTCCKQIEMVFDDRKKVIEMWQSHGIFVFDVSQGKGDF